MSDFSKNWQKDKHLNEGMFLHDQLQHRLNQQKRTFTKTPIAAPPEQLMLQYIGGPKNGEQEYFNWKACPFLQQGKIYFTGIPGSSTPQHQVILEAAYKLTFIPMNETPFSDAQIVIAVFQE